MNKEIFIAFTKRQRELVLKYGYPFEGIREQLKKNEDNEGTIGISDDEYWWEQLAGDLASSLNKEEDIPDDGTYEELEEIFEIVERELKRKRRIVVL